MIINSNLAFSLFCFLFFPIIMMLWQINEHKNKFFRFPELHSWVCVQGHFAEVSL